MKYNYQQYPIRMRLILSLLLFTLAVQQSDCEFSNSQCQFSFVGEACTFSACHLATTISATENGNQTILYLWEECLKQCCQTEATEGGQQTMVYLTEHCAKKPDESLLAVIVGFSIGIPLFIVILICVYCKTWKCLNQHTETSLQATRRGETQEKIRSVILQSSSFSFDGDKKTDSIISFHNAVEQNKASQICSICLEADTTVKTQCGHHFHHDCLVEWLKKTQNCPDCRNSNLNRFQILCCQCQRLSRAIGTLSMGSSYACKQCTIHPN